MTTTENLRTVTVSGLVGVALAAPVSESPAFEAAAPAPAR